MENVFKKMWSEAEASRPKPRFLRNVKTISFADYQAKVHGQDLKFAEEWVDSIFSGDAYIIRDVFEPGFLRDLKRRVFAYGRELALSSQKIVEGCPNYHESMEHNLYRPNGYVARDHSYYFFRWNPDPLGVFEAMAPLWKTHKVMSGHSPDRFEANRPSDGAVDRVQVIHYPKGAGKITSHSDPDKYQRAIVGTMLTEAGKDYEEGGFYLLGRDRRPVSLDRETPAGSALSVYPTMFHGVSVVDPTEKPDWSSEAGRWYVSLFTVDSHHVDNRVTALPPPEEAGIPDEC